MDGYQRVAFCTPTIPENFNNATPGPSTILLAREMFGFDEKDFNPKHKGSFFGASKYGYTYEVEVKKVVAEGLSGRRLPSVLNIYE